jgi:hypothetical protein
MRGVLSMKKMYLALVLVIFFVMAQSVLAVMPTWGSAPTPISVTPTRENALTDANAIFTCTACADVNYLCVGTSDSNTVATNCVATTTSINAPLSNFSGLSLSEGKNTLYFFLLNVDGNYSQTSKPADFNLDTTAPVITGSLTSNPTITDGNYYNTTSFSSVTITIPESDIDTITVTIDGTTTYHTSSPISIGAKTFYDGSHTIIIDANDNLNNRNQTPLSFTFGVDTNVPVLHDANSANRTTWTNDEAPDFVINATDNNSAMTSGTAAFSCSSTGTFQQIAFTSTTVSTFDITASAYDCNTIDGNKAVYIKVKDAAGNWSNVVSTNVLYDNTAPSTPTNLTAVGNNAEVYLSWTAPGADNLSGNAGYQIFQGDTLKTTTTSTSATVTGLTNGTSYTFKVRTYDNAGNESGDSGTASATPSSTTDNPPASTLSSEVSVKRGTIATDYVKSGTSLTVTCSYSSEVDGAKIYYKYYNPNQTDQILKGPTNDVASLEDSITVSGSYEKIGFWCYGSNSTTSTTSAIKYVYLDGTSPTLYWAFTETELSGNIIIKASASDDKLLSQVEFELNNVKYGTTKDGNTYTYTLDTNSIANGTYTLKAIATDGAGNVKEITRSITISNIVTPEQEKVKAISDAKVKKQIIEDMINYLEGKGVIINQEIKDDKAEADALLNEAELTTEIALAIEKAEGAKTIYNQINSELPESIQTFSLSKYVFDSDMLENRLIELGLAEYSEEIIEMIQNTNVERTFEVIKVGDIYQAKINIKIVNETGETVLKIIEIIPKEFATSASAIFSSHDFVIIQEDPILEFTIDAPIGSSVEFSYSIGELTEEEANALIDKNIMMQFVSPPLVTSESTNISNVLKEDNGLAFTMAIIAIVIIILIVIGIVAFVYMKKGTGTPSFGTKSAGITEKMKNKINGLGKGKDKAGPGKWKYKN